MGGLTRVGDWFIAVYDRSDDGATTIASLVSLAADGTLLAGPVDLPAALPISMGMGFAPSGGTIGVLWWEASAWSGVPRTEHVTLVSPELSILATTDLPMQAGGFIADPPGWALTLFEPATVPGGDVRSYFARLDPAGVLAGAPTLVAQGPGLTVPVLSRFPAGYLVTWLVPIGVPDWAYDSLMTWLDPTGTVVARDIPLAFSPEEAGAPIWDGHALDFVVRGGDWSDNLNPHVWLSLWRWGSDLAPLGPPELIADPAGGGGVLGGGRLLVLYWDGRCVIGCPGPIAMTIARFTCAP